jgi:hypothetical protein
MRRGPSGPRVPNEILRYSFPISTDDAGTTSAPLWSSPGAALVDTAGLGLISLPWTALPGRLDLASVSVISSGDSTGDLISLQWMAATTLIPEPVGDPVPDFVDPTSPAGVVTRQLDFSSVSISDRGAGISPYLVIPANLNAGTVLSVLLSVAVYWRENAIRGKLG